MGALMAEDEKTLIEQIKTLQGQVAALQAKLEPAKPSGVSVVSNFERYDPTENMTRLPRTRDEMPEWMQQMVNATPDQLMADIRSDRTPRSQPGSLEAYPASERGVAVVGSRHDKAKG
jgi:hypothetical protein